MIAASPEWLDHLVGVLIDNACKYTPEQGTIEVRVAAEASRIKLAVDDSGPGIPVDERGQIFDRFRRASDLPGGSGLGLAIADAVVSATNGRWEVGTSAAGGASNTSWPRRCGNSQWSVVSGQLSVVRGQGSVVTGGG